MQSTIMWLSTLFVVLGIVLHSNGHISRNQRSFTIDLERNTFLKDGEPYVYLSGSLHYFRVPYYYWADRLNKMFAAGLDAVETYIAWNVHEPIQGKYDFDGQQNLIGFIKAAQNAGLLVILRPGPYICAEWEYGGFPAWLLSTTDTFTIRSMNATNYIGAVEKWMSVVLPKLKPYLYSNGGPIIMIQVENEYGSYRSVDCGHDYMAYLRDLFRKHLGDDIVLFSTDGNAYELLECGAIEGVYATVDFGPDQSAPQAFEAMRKWNPKGPLVNSECYTGWLDHWGSGHAHGSTDQLIKGLLNLRQFNASVNMYMFEGGTSFGFMNGADPTFAICPTSYDYDAPLTEAGDITDKYMAIRNFTAQYKKLPPVPQNISKYAYGEVRMTKVASVLNLLHIVSSSKPVTSIYPLHAEMGNFFYGFVLYRHIIKEDTGSDVLHIPQIRDRAYILINGIPRGVLDRSTTQSLSLFTMKGQVLDIIVENQGRLNYGAAINDNKKGIICNVTLGGTTLTDWEMYGLEFEKLFNRPVLNNLWFSEMELSAQLPYEPTVYSGSFVVPDFISPPQDTFMNMCGWFKGQVYINGYNLGRYWPVIGPQVTLYVPAGILRPSPQTNVIIMVELDSAPSTTSRSSSHSHLEDSQVDDVIEFITKPIINGRCFRRNQILPMKSQRALYHRVN